MLSPVAWSGKPNLDSRARPARLAANLGQVGPDGGQDAPANAMSSATPYRWQRRPGMSPRNPWRVKPLRILSPFGISCA
jgi:hypothetical protein